MEKLTLSLIWHPEKRGFAFAYDRNPSASEALWLQLQGLLHLLDRLADQARATGDAMLHLRLASAADNIQTEVKGLLDLCVVGEDDYLEE